VAGLGSIGRCVVERARAFGMQVSAWSRSLTPSKADRLGVRRATSLVELAASCDVLSVHLPLTPQTRGAVDREVIESLPDGAMLINTARAELVDYDVLAELAPKKRLRLGLDVFDGEPKAGSAEFRPAILDVGVVYGTPHIGASTEQAQRAIATEVCRIVRAFMTEVEVPNVVNVCRNTPARFALVLRALDEVGVLANVLNVLKRHGLNVEEISNTVFDGARATCTKLRVSGRPDEACLSEIRAFDEVLYVDVVPLPNLA
jgi:D-3-phosphoglycerate dehydrogenase